MPDVRVAYETWGSLNADRSNAIYVCHALTGDSHVAGPAGAGHRTVGWWDGLVGPGKAIDTDEWFVVCATCSAAARTPHPTSSLAPDGRPWGSRFPVLSRSPTWSRSSIGSPTCSGTPSMLGPSLGGMRVLEWLVRHPSARARRPDPRLDAAVTADQIGLTRLAAIEGDPAFRGGDYYDAAPGEGPHAGMGLARRIAHLTYRCDTELDLRFGRDPQADEDPYAGGRFAIESYLDHHADKLARRFDANTYVALDAGHEPVRCRPQPRRVGERPRRRHRPRDRDRHRLRPPVPRPAAAGARRPDPGSVR